MKIGIIIFSFSKMFQGKSKPKVVPENYILVSDDNLLKEKIEVLFKKPIQLLQNTQSFSENKNQEIIFDNNYVDFKTIIRSLELNKNKKHTFKIIPKHTDFLIGSNTSFDRGEVVLF